jgi:hypothetical protein
VTDVVLVRQDLDLGDAVPSSGHWFGSPRGSAPDSRESGPCQYARKKLSTLHGMVLQDRL